VPAHHLAAQREAEGACIAVLDPSNGALAMLTVAVCQISYGLFHHRDSQAFGGVQRCFPIVHHFFTLLSADDLNCKVLIR
jgi:hypothetical protein